jgi:hypothetical protein
MTRILFIGDSWQGSSGRSLREALATSPDVVVSDVSADLFIPNYTGIPLRIANRLLRKLQLRELERAVRQAASGCRPDVLLVYKGAGIETRFLREMQQSGVATVNVFPDCSPHAHGRHLREALGCYDLVISAKPYHPARWESVYGYRNACVCVLHGYDPDVHYWAEPPRSFKYDVALCGTWRPQYHRLMQSFGEALGDDSISVAIGGNGWLAHRGELPRHWQYVGERLGRSYGELVRSAKIVLAPVTRELTVRGIPQPGDEETTRTYELAAAHCFFVHQRTDFVATLYDESTEVPFWESGTELAQLVRRWLPDDEGRRAMAARAHARAVPAYSVPARATEVLEHVRKLIAAPGVAQRARSGGTCNRGVGVA